MIRIVSSRRLKRLENTVETLTKKNKDLEEELKQLKTMSEVQGSRVLGLKLLQVCIDRCSSVEERSKLELLAKLAELDMCYANVVTYCLPGRSATRKVITVDPCQIPWTYKEMKKNLRKILNYLELKDVVQPS